MISLNYKANLQVYENIELGIIVLFTQSLMIPHWFSEFNTEKMYIEIEWGENK